MREIMNRKKYRNLLAEVIAENINTFEPEDLWCEFTETDEVRKLINNLDGDIDTNPVIAKFNDEGVALVKQSLYNLSAYIKQQLPLWIISDKFLEKSKGAEE